MANGLPRQRGMVLQTVMAPRPPSIPISTLLPTLSCLTFWLPEFSSTSQNFQTSLSPGKPRSRVLFNLTDPVATEEAQLADTKSHRTGYPLHAFPHTIPTTFRVLSRSSASIARLLSSVTSGYTTTSFTLLSYVTLKLTGLSVPRFTQKYIFEPLGMKESTFDYQTGFNSPGKLAYGMARSDWDPYKDPFAGTTDADDDGNVLFGAGGVLTTAVDMAQWLKVLLQLGGKHPDTGEQVMPQGVFDEIASAIIPSGPYPPVFPEYSIPMYGSAQLQLYYRGHYALEHGGFIRGFNTQISLPNDFIRWSVLSNDNEHGMQINQKLHLRSCSRT